LAVSKAHILPTHTEGLFARAPILIKRGPRKQRKAQVNGGGVQRIGGLEFKTERFIGVEHGGLLDVEVGKVSKNAPVPHFIDHRQRVAGGGLADAGVIEFRAEGRQTGFDVPQTFAPGQLGEREHEELFVSGQLAELTGGNYLVRVHHRGIGARPRRKNGGGRGQAGRVAPRPAGAEQRFRQPGVVRHRGAAGRKPFRAHQPPGKFPPESK